MESSSYFKSACAHCGGHIEAPAEGAGMWVRCPHCGEKTQLVAPSPKLASPPTTPTKYPSRAFWIILVLAIIVVAGTYFIFRWIQFRRESAPQLRTTLNATNVTPANPKTPQQHVPEPDLWNGLKPGTITIEKPSNGKLMYAVGTIRNDTDKQRYGVKVTLDVLDKNGEKIGSALDQTQFIDAHKEWNFRALVTSSKAKSAKVTAITED